MSFEYGCFVSYAHPEGKMMKTFIEDLVLALESELDPYIRNQVYFDKARLKPGYEFDSAISHGLCASACWIMVYVPQYSKRDYCLREFQAMQILQQQRQTELGKQLAKYRSMIIPILVRGTHEELPSGVEKNQCLEFEQLTLAKATISDRPKAMAQISELAAEIHEIYKLGQHLNQNCEAFEIPAAEASDFTPIPPPFPGDPDPDGGGEQAEP